MPEPETSVAISPNAVAITVDGQEVVAEKGELVIDACERHGVYIPRFCYHPRMTPVGMCRMCLVEIDTGRGPALQPSCMIQVAPDMKVDTASEVTKKAQDGILEFLLINHPLDCPVCDKGGECPLQDQTLAYGPGESRFVEEKRHFEKPIPISDVVFLDRERCILCDRCTRFAKEVAGDPLIHFQGRGGQSQVNTFPDHPFSSYFSGNTVQICPVGALTAKPFRFKARPWDLEQTESTCTSCSVGCRMVIDSSRNQVLRYNGVDIDPVNWGWLCDKGRFDFEAFQSDQRLTDPLVRGHAGDDLTEARWSDALGAAAEAIKATTSPTRVAVLGGARLTNESAYAWAKLAKGVIGTDNVDAQLGDGLRAEAVLGLPRATIDDVCRPGGTVIYLGPDPKEELPVLFLRLRHAITNDRVKLVELAPQDTGLSDLATHSLRYLPGTAADVCAQLVDAGTEPVGLDAPKKRTVADLLTGGPVTVVLGRPSLAESAATIEAAAAVLVEHLDGVRFLPALRRANVHGALDLGLAPGVLPGRVSLDHGRDWFAKAWGAVPAERGLDAAGILQAAADGELDTLVLLGADPLVDFPDRTLAAKALEKTRIVVAVDLFLTASAAVADIVLPAAGFGEVEGTTTNQEGRVSVLGQKVTPPGTARSDWMIAAELALRLDGDLELESVDDIWDEIERLSVVHSGVKLSLLKDPAAADGIVVPLHDTSSVTATPQGIEGTALTGKPKSVTGVGEPEQEAEAEAHPEAAADDDRLEAQGPTTGTSDRGDQADSDAAESARRSREDEEPDGEAVAGEARRAGDQASESARRSREDEEPDGEAVAGEARRAGDQASTAPAARPGQITFSADPAARRVPPADSYSLRLVVTRKLYDQGTLVQHSPSLAPLANPALLRINPYDFERLGVSEGGDVKVTSRVGSATVPTTADAGVPRGCASVLFNQLGVDPTALLDLAGPVTDIRVETP